MWEFPLILDSPFRSDSSINETGKGKDKAQGSEGKERRPAPTSARESRDTRRWLWSHVACEKYPDRFCKLWGIAQARVTTDNTRKERHC